MNQRIVHGPLSCSKCFSDCNLPQQANGWQLVNDPGYWGAPDPRVLVLGQSKGNRQRQVYEQGSPRFDGVAFAGIRDRLAEVLERLSIQLDKLRVDRHFTASETDVGFASLLRCSLSDPAGRTSGSPVMHAMDDPEANRWIETCMQTWLTHLNPRLQVVVFLGLTDRYMQGVIERLGRLHRSTFRREGKFAVRAAGVSWVFAQHPSTISENHYRRWLAPAPHGKRDLARDVVAKALARQD